MEEYLKDTTKGFGERFRRLAIFTPLFSLKGKRKSAALPFDIDWFSLGLLTLLFFFESKLHRQGKKGRQELADYLYELTQVQIGASRAHYDLITETIMDTFRDPMGKRHNEVFFNWETGDQEVVQFSLLKTDAFDQENNRQYFTLDEAGLELIFATKEYFSEFRISIAQLLIRKQLEKGEFSSALHEIHEMRIAVQALRDHIQRLGLEVTRNIISDDTYGKYAKTIENVYERLTREDEEFRELYSFVRETTAKLQFESQEQVDEEARLQIAQVSIELGEVHQLHHGLLYNVMQLKNKALEAARQALFSAGIQSFNFDQEIVSRIVSSPLPEEAVKGLVHPFTRLHQQTSWSLLALLFPQRLQRSDQEEETAAYPEMEEEEYRQHTLQQEENFGRIMEEVIQVMDGKDSMELKDMVSGLPGELLQHRSFYDFWLLLHQRSPVVKGVGEGKHVLDKALALLGDDILEVGEKPEFLQITEQYTLQNMCFTRRRKNE
ncbi:MULTISPECIES: hypothetical protein [Pelosinus]|uniref:Replicative DNA helicase n=1 Tax=Pelosinus fermentans B4 TaxID=1149862 RepID=I9B730_9FIRM|nr:MULTISPECIES: hypothetical protein [Pelosinus]EIW20937.1 hypothetical protein FB4_1789 [Pelosinus fermentans B4]EIW27196.1 hypothetical protein FA11_1215 [Pelosinus fermentans A11]